MPVKQRRRSMGRVEWLSAKKLKEEKVSAGRVAATGVSSCRVTEGHWVWR